MKVFVAGASGAIGQPLIARLIGQGHQVTGMARSESAARKLLDEGACAELANALDASAVEQALRRARPEAVIDQLTALPEDPADLPGYLAGDVKLRIEGGGNLHRTAMACGVKRYLQQSSGFFLQAGDGLANESVPMASNASINVARSARIYTELEARVLAPGEMHGTALRYGFFYGPGTWYHPEGGYAQQVREGRFPIVGTGDAVWSFVHVEDAAAATVAALTAAPSVYNVVDDDPLPIRQWLPRFAEWLKAPPVPFVSEEAARATAGEDAVYYGMKLRGASNAKAKRELSFAPRPLEWMTNP
jgi:2-alkyl-3-oxoalkanoate reductase